MNCSRPERASFSPNTLRGLPGEYSAMHLVSIMNAAFQQIALGEEVGIDLSREYQIAQSVHLQEQAS